MEKKKINLFQPSIDKEELLAINNVFESNWINKGKRVSEFEEQFAKHLNCSSKQLLSTTSCTEAIFLSTKIFNINKNDEVIIPTNSFPSIANAIKESGAKIIFCDINKRTLNVELSHFKHLINKKTKAIYITHYGGVSAEMLNILQICSENNIKVIEDAACAVSSSYKGNACGTLGDMGFWSFDAMKTLTTGDGGMIFFKKEEDRIEAQEWLYLGLSAKEKSGLDKSAHTHYRWWEFDIKKPGRRAIMNDITASIGLVQLNKLPTFIQKRKEVDRLYREQLQGLDNILLPLVPSVDDKHSYYFFWIQIEQRDELARFLLDNGVYCTFRYWPLHKIKFFNEDNTQLNNANYVADVTLNLPIHQSMSHNDVIYICDLIKLFLKR